MRLQFLLVLVLACVAVGMDDVSVPNTHVDSGIIYAADFNANNDTLEARINGNKDTLEVKFIRFTDMNDGDSTLDTVKVNAIRGNPDIDSISGNPLIDSVAVAYVSVDTIRSKPDVDSLQGRPWVDTLDLDALRGNPDVDSIAGNPTIDSAAVAYVAVDTIRSNPDVDSLSGNITIDSAAVAYIALDTLRGNPSIDSLSVNQASPSYRVTFGSADGSNEIGIYHDNTNAYMVWDDGSLQLSTDEGTNTNTTIGVSGKGTGLGEVLIYDQDAAEYLQLRSTSGNAEVAVAGSSPVSLSIQKDAAVDVKVFANAADGETPELKIYGFRTSDANRSLEIGVGEDAANTASFDGLGTYLFDGKIQGDSLVAGHANIDTVVSATVDINGGAIDGTPIGAAAQADANVDSLKIDEQLSFLQQDGTLSNNTLTYSGAVMRIDTEASAALDTLDAISAAGGKDIVVLFSTDGGRDILVQDGANLHLAGGADFTLGNVVKTITLMHYASGQWMEISRSDN